MYTNTHVNGGGTPLDRSVKQNTDMITADVLEALRNGDRRAYERVYIKYSHKVMVFINSLISPYDEAEELTQDVFVNLWVKRQNIDPRGNFGGYLHEHARDCVLKHLYGKHTPHVNSMPEHDDWDGLDTLESEFTHTSLARVKESIGMPASETAYANPGRDNPARTGRERRNTGWKVAAITIPLVMLLVGGFLFWRMMAPSGQPAQETATAETQQHARIEVAATESDKKIMLVDGTIIWIRKGGHISYPATYTTGREISLYGEAYFDVAKDEQRPLTISTDQLAVRVTGTEVNINTQGDHETTQVRLVAGSAEVSVLEGTGRYKISPGENLVIGRDTKTLTLEKSPVGVMSDWRRESMAFSYMTLEEVFDSLGKLYNVPFVFEAERLRGDDRMSFTLDGSEKLEDVMAMIYRISGKFTYVIEKDKVNIYQQPTQYE